MTKTINKKKSLEPDEISIRLLKMLRDVHIKWLKDLLNKMMLEEIMSEKCYSTYI